MSTCGRRNREPGRGVAVAGASTPPLGQEHSSFFSLLSFIYTFVLFSLLLWFLPLFLFLFALLYFSFVKFKYIVPLLEYFVSLFWCRLFVNAFLSYRLFE